jgi:nucleoside-diphosphate-sugar epimerase
MNLIVSGPSGFVGRNLLEALSRIDLSAIDIFLVTRARPDWLHLTKLNAKSLSVVSWHELDSYEINHESPSVVVHLAATSRGSSASIKANVEITQKLLSFCDSARQVRFIQVSSVSVFGEFTSGHFSDTSPFAADTAYAHSKIECEELCQAWQLAKPREVWILRPSLMYGRYDRGPLFAYAAILKKGIALGIGRNDILRSWTSVEMLAETILDLLQRPFSPGIKTVTIVDEKMHSLAEIVEIFKKDSLAFKFYLPTTLAEISAAVFKLCARILPLFSPLDSALRKALRSGSFDRTYFVREFPNLKSKSWARAIEDLYFQN